MLIVIAGERCTGKSALARAIMEKIHAEIFSGRDSVRLASRTSTIWCPPAALW